MKFPIKGAADSMFSDQGIDTTAFDCAGCKIPDGTITPPVPPSGDGDNEPSG